MRLSLRAPTSRLLSRRHTSETSNSCNQKQQRERQESDTEKRSQNIIGVFSTVARQASV